MVFPAARLIFGIFTGACLIIIHYADGKRQRRFCQGLRDLTGSRVKSMPKNEEDLLLPLEIFNNFSFSF